MSDLLCVSAARYLRSGTPERADQTARGNRRQQSLRSLFLDPTDADLPIARAGSAKAYRSSGFRQGAGWATPEVGGDPSGFDVAIAPVIAARTGQTSTTQGGAVMAKARNPIAELCAIAAMPGIEDLAQVIAPYCKGSTDPNAQIIYLAGQWVTGSRNKLTSLLRDEAVWGEMRASAARTGRALPHRPPSEDKQRHIRDRADDANFGQQLADAFVPATAPLARMVGLMGEDTPSNLLLPNRANMAYADGSKFKAFSDIYLDPETGEIVGSLEGRVSPRMLVPEVTVGKNGCAPQVPIATVGAHGGLRHQRVMLAVGLFMDYDEMDESMRLFHKVRNVYGSALHAFIYDMALSGAKIQEVLRSGVIPIVDMMAADPKNPHLPVPKELQALLGRAGRPKLHARIHRLSTENHQVGGSACTHAIWTIDGSPVTCDPGDLRPSFDNPSLSQPELEFTDHPAGDGKQLMATYTVPCEHGGFPLTIDLASDLPNSAGDYVPVARYLRPIDSKGHLLDLRGYRSDVESSYRTIKAQSALFGRAHSLNPDHFLADMVGAGLWMNSTAWDVHAAQHTTNGQRLWETMIRAEDRKNIF